MNISVYSKNSIIAPSAYYRFYQYFIKLDDKYQVKFNNQYSERFYLKFMPINGKNILIKIYAFFIMNIRVFAQLLSDYFSHPNVIIVSRRFTNKIMFSYQKAILISLKKKYFTRIIWDFDDNILESKEITIKNFSFLEGISDKIVVTGDILKNLVSQKFQHKVVKMPTTDGDIYNKYKVSDDKRLELFESIINIVWLGTSGNLKYVSPLIPILDMVFNDINKQINFYVISDGEINVETKNIKLINVEWERNKAAEIVLNAHIGVMPLIDNVFTRGKGGFKLIQYLSAGVPIIGSAVGFNETIFDKKNGFMMNDIYNKDELEKAISEILKDSNTWKKYSINALNSWKKNYSFDSNLESWERIINQK